MKPDPAHITLHNNVPNIKKMLMELILRPRRDLAKWAKVTKQTPNIKIGRRRPLHWIGVDEVSRRKGHRYLTVVYDLERRTLLWVGEDRTEQTLREFFSELGRRRLRSLPQLCRLGCCDPHADRSRLAGAGMALYLYAVSRVSPFAEKGC